ncbi:MAG TPA: HAMP domain-containing sensor histidine kinase [bacterium]|nr:HAMP domain-containing sensor histidine kinase [bacterium]HOL46722.1 HAMP domain-containing sensor histidine kinase [bacterium]HPQ18158.1 HAMP domain-containing sensor histidine kinase [bacterium]
MLFLKSLKTKVFLMIIFLLIIIIFLHSLFLNKFLLSSFNKSFFSYNYKVLDFILLCYLNSTNNINSFINHLNNIFKNDEEILLVYLFNENKNKIYENKKINIQTISDKTINDFIEEKKFFKIIDNLNDNFIYLYFLPLSENFKIKPMLAKANIYEFKNNPFLIIGFSNINYNRELNNLQKKLIIYFVIFFFIISFIILSYLNKLLKPITILLSLTKHVANGDFNVHYPFHKGDELEILGNAFNKMISSLKEYDEKLKFMNMNLQAEVSQKTKKLAEALTKLRELDRLKDEFITLIAHEFRTPMTIINSFLETIAMYDNIEKDVKDEMVKATKIEVNNLINKIEKIILLQRLKLEKYEQKKVKINLYHYIQVVLKEVKNKNTKNVSVKIDIPEDYYIFFDNSLLYHLLYNLIENGIMYNKENGELQINLIEDNILQFKDTGIGISKEELLFIFDEFKQLGNINEHSSGIGIGLSIVKYICQITSILIEIESEKNVGTTIYLIL